MAVLKEITYLGRDNPNTVEFKEGGVVIDFDGASVWSLVSGVAGFMYNYGLSPVQSKSGERNGMHSIESVYDIEGDLILKEI